MISFNFKNISHVFIDFDGTLKDTDKIKGTLFVNIFEKNNKHLKDKINNHHLNNLGVTRLKKIPLYMKWSKIPVNQKNKKKYLNKYKKEIFKKVCLSSWMPGAYKFLKNSSGKKKIYLLTATPNKEISKICKTINVTSFFEGIFGYPYIKEKIVSEIIKKKKLKKAECIYIGNAFSDYKAAKLNKINYIHFDKDNKKFKNNKFTINNFNKLKI